MMNAGISSRLPVIAIMGPTGAGKTDVALELAARFPVEIISVDSALVYRGMDIGTGKPGREALRRVTHHLVDILDPANAYSAGQFASDASLLIREIHARRRIPLLVGGTMLYFRALTRGLAKLPPADVAIREELNQRAQHAGWPALHQELATLDPAAAKRIQPNDGQRIQRALEVFRISGSTLTALQADTRSPIEDVDLLRFVWSPKERQQLYARIELRFHRMISAGFEDEVRALHRRSDLAADLPSIRSVGYRQLWEHLDGLYGLDEAVRRAVVATRHLARRQLIWLRAEPNLPWINSEEADAASILNRTMEHLATRSAL
jgi:tRNA dimethylallyltransferase